MCCEMCPGDTPGDRVLMIQPLDPLWRKFVFEFHARTSSYLDSFYVLRLLRCPVRCSVMRCLLVTTLSREASLTVATERLGSRLPRQARSYIRAVQRCAKMSVSPRYIAPALFLHNYWNIFQRGATHRNTVSKIYCQANALVQKRYERHSSSGRLMQNGLDSHAHLRVNLAAIN